MKLVMLRGLPGSGKSTLSKEIMQKGGNYIRCNRDLLREMLHHGKWSGRNEGIVIDFEIAIAKKALSLGINVLIDDCNFGQRNKDRWSTIANECGASFEIKTTTDTPVEVCIDRDALREKKVGAHVIKKMALEHMDYLKGQKVLCCDIDGTIADITHRLQYARGETKNWDTFFSLIHLDTPRWEVLKRVYEIVDEHKAKLIFVSARPETYRAQTQLWMQAYGIEGYELLIMREANDKRPDTEVKTEIYNRYLKNLDIVAVFDDRPQVIVNTWTPLVGKNKVIDVGNNDAFKDEREALNYSTNS